MNEQTRGLSRRSFLTGAAGMGALAALGLTGCAAPKNAAERAADMAAIKSGNASAGASGVDWLGTAPEIASGDIKETVETDVLVVGAGMSGIMAGATLAELGANFVIVEKGAESAATHYDIGAIHSRWQKEQNLDFEESRWINEHARYASFKNDQSVLRTWIENSGATVEWIADTYTKHFGQESKVVVDTENDNAGGTSYFIPPECHHVSNPGFVNERGQTEHVKAMTKVIEDDGGQVLYSHDLVKLVQDGDGAVTGAIFKVENGYKQVNAKKGVILACGGYAANADMLQARDPEAVRCITSLNYNTNNTGAGIKAAHDLGAQIGIVVGGGNFWRGRSSGKMDRMDADKIGMLATVMNALAVKDALRQQGVEAVVMTSSFMPQVAECFTSDKAIAALESGKIVVFGGGTGNPIFSTDTASALRALEISADAMFKATMVDGVYDKDPHKYADAVRYDTLTFTRVLDERLAVMDSTAATLCRDNGLPILVFDLGQPENIAKAVQGEMVGTLVKE